jgi:hypothetical protein
MRLRLLFLGIYSGNFIHFYADVALAPAREMMWHLRPRLRMLSNTIRKRYQKWNDCRQLLQIGYILMDYRY